MTHHRRAAVLLAIAVVAVPAARAGNPRFINRGGGPLIWNPGVVNYATTPNDLSPTVTHAVADAIVAADAAVWSNVPTASIALAQSGSLAEVVDGSNFYLSDSGIVMPADVSANGTGPAIAVLYDADGSLTDTLLGSGASAPANCRQNAVTNTVDGFGANGFRITHAILILNGRCVAQGTHDELLQLQYQLLRAWGRVLGVGWSQLNDNVFTGSPQPTLDQYQDWPIMHPIDILCGPYSYLCMPQPFTLRMDDISTLSQLYPMYHSADLFLPGKQLTLQSAMQIAGSLSFPDGQGMQGVNIEAHICYAGSAICDTGAIVSSVTGFGFTADTGTPITGATSAYGTPLSQRGATDTFYQGFYDLNEIDSNYAWLNVGVVPVAVNPLYIGDYAVGPFTDRQIAPSGTLASQVAYGIGIGAGSWFNFTFSDAARPLAALDTTELTPAAVPATGWWSSTLSTFGHTDWYALNVPSGGTLSVEVTALDESGHPSTTKMLPIIGLWNASAATGTLPDYAAASAFNSVSIATTTLAAPSGALRLAIADADGGGRPDFTYTARILAATAVSSTNLPAAGASLTINGMGFRRSMKVTIGGVVAPILNATANSLAVAAPALASITGASVGSALDVAVTDLITGSVTTLPAAVTYAAPLPAVTPLLIILSGDAQSLPAADPYSPVVLEATDGAGHPVAGVAITIDQQVTALQPACPSTGRCPQPAVYTSGSLTLTTNATGQVSLSPLTVTGQSQTRILATIPSGGQVQTTLQHL